MTKDEMTKRNLDLTADFMRYAFDHPDILDLIPKDAHLVLLPLHDRELYRENIKTLHRLKTENEKYVVFKIETIKPKIEYLDSSDIDAEVEQIS